jgi:SAM-dependent methyltransferase
MGSAADRWRELQEARAIPPGILAAAPDSPYKHDPAHFKACAEPADTPSRRAALGRLGDGGGSVLDVGCGGGAASLAVAEAADLLIGVDHHPGMLEVFAADCAARGIAHRTVLGAWPDVADRAGPADVVVCHHVGYNTPELAPFFAALTAAARRGVVVELTAEHPMAWLDPLWARFHDVHRGGPATAEDAVAVLAELGITPTVTRWDRGARLPEDPVWVAKRLCLTDDRIDEVAEALAAVPPRTREAVTLTW